MLTRLIAGCAVVAMVTAGVPYGWWTPSALAAHHDCCDTGCPESTGTPEATDASRAASSASSSGGGNCCLTSGDPRPDAAMLVEWRSAGVPLPTLGGLVSRAVLSVVSHGSRADLLARPAPRHARPTVLLI